MFSTALKLMTILSLLSPTSKSQAEEVKLIKDLKVLDSRFKFTEGPLWDGDGFIFSDIPASKVYKWNESGVTTVLENSHYSNGRAKTADGEIISAHHDRTIKRLKNDILVNFVDKYNGLKLNSPNDLIVHSSGNIYFTDPNYGITYEGFGPYLAKEEQPVRGIYRITKDKKILLLNGDLKLPNGLAFSPDEKILYVADSESARIYSFKIDKNGNLTNKKLFAIAQQGEKAMADGMKVDKEGNIYIAIQGAILVLSPNGSVLQVLKVPEEAVANLAFGGVDGRTLFITASKSIYTARTVNPGAH